MGKQLKVLVACETSGMVREAFRKKGWLAYSCDFLPADDGSENHFILDAKKVLNKFFQWDLLVAHPPCQYLCSSGMHWTKRGFRDPKLTEDALDFVKFFMDQPINHICIENPVGIISKRIRKPDQYIQPYNFGHCHSKKTCLWLKNLPPLKNTETVPPDRIINGKPRYKNQTDSGQSNLGPSEDRWQKRSKTYSGIAAAMADQWTEFFVNNYSLQENLFSHSHIVHNTNTISKDI